MTVAAPDFWIIFKLAFIFILIILALRLKLSLGLSLIISALFLVLMFRLDAVEIFRNIARTILEPDPKTGSFITIELMLILYLIGLLESVMRKAGVFDSMIASAGHLLRDPRKVAVFFPVLLGVLPSAGGARFSAPMVGEVLKGSYMKPSKKAFANYWFRHIWEPVLPLYPGLLLASALTGVAISSFVACQWPIALFMLLTGWFVSFHKVPKPVYMPRDEKAEGHHLLNLLEGTLPVLFIAAAVLLNNRLFIPALIAVITVIIAIYRIEAKLLPGLLKKALSVEILLLIFGVMYFKNMLEISGAISELNFYFSFAKISPLLIVFALPFIAGLLTGVVQAYVVITIPLIMPFLSAGGILNIPMISFAFISGYAGVLLSPVHLCYVLSCGYFEVEITEGYPFLCMLVPFLPAISFCLALLKNSAL